MVPSNFVTRNIKKNYENWKKIKNDNIILKLI